MLNTADILTQLDQRRRNYSLSRDLYCDEGVYRADLENIWYREWIFAIPACDIPKTGNNATLQIGEYPILIVRGADGQIRAFHNVCRHRGARVLQDYKTSVGNLVCRYHAWTYDLDGKLLFAEHMGKDFDAGCHGRLDPCDRAGCRRRGRRPCGRAGEGPAAVDRGR